MYHEAIQVLAVSLAKADGWDITISPCSLSNPRMKVYLNKAETCLQSLAQFLESKEVAFEDLDILDRYAVPKL